MSSDASFTALLALIQRDLYRIGGPILMFVGTVSCILSLIVFTKKNLRKNPCSIYLVAFNISNFFLIFTSILFSTLAGGFRIDPSLYSLSFCRFRFYTTFIFDILSPSYLILASADRILVTSRNARTRQRSTCRLAFVCIILVTLFWLLLHIHILILTNIIEFAPGFFVCYLQPGMHTTLVTYYSVLIKNILIPLLMTICGIWAMKNVRTVAHVIPASVIPTHETTIIRNSRADRSKDRQLLRILLIDITIYVIFNVMIAIVLMYQQFHPTQVTDLVELQIQSLLFSVGLFSTFIPFCVGCYTNLLASKTFRQEIINILLCK